MNWKKKLLSVAAVVFVALNLATPAPASSIIHVWMTCTTGSITGTLDSLELTPFAENGMRRFIARGTLTPCHAPSVADAYTVSVYRGLKYTYSSPSPYVDLWNPNGTFQTNVDFIPGLRAICLNSGPSTKLGCFEVSWPTLESTPTVIGPIPTNSPLTNSTVMLNEKTGPNCAPVCWPMD
ncbi:hypothetical protein R8Z50_32585 [Longispora sp. K20-0274]|uniref:hypothetical protein n=1 Tax=Longispora sp. K20-0274 TaxID=3088255 RepID=UPI00399BD328